MSVNRDKPDRWKDDIAASVDMYNEWFVKFAPAAYRRTREKTTVDVEAMLQATDNLAHVNVPLLQGTTRRAACVADVDLSPTCG